MDCIKCFDEAICINGGTVNNHIFTVGEVYPAFKVDGGIRIAFGCGDIEHLDCFTNGKEYYAVDKNGEPCSPAFVCADEVGAVVSISEELNEFGKNLLIALKCRVGESADVFIDVMNDNELGITILPQGKSTDNYPLIALQGLYDAFEDGVPIEKIANETLLMLLRCWKNISN